MALGSIVVRLTMDTATFDTDAGRAAKIAEKRAKEIDASFKRAGAAIGVALGVVAVAGINAFIKNTIEAERVGAQLDAKITALGGAAAVSANDVKDLADSLQAVSTFDDEAITEASTALLSFTNIKAPEFARTLAAALDLAAATGDDLTLTTEKLGKALNEPDRAAKALRDTGIALTDAQKDLIKELVETGRQGEAQAIILGELESRYKGAATAAKDTLGGAFKSLQNAAANLMEGPDGSLDGVTGAVNSLTDTLSSSETKQAFADIIELLARMASGALDAAGAISQAFKTQDEQSLAFIKKERDANQKQIDAWMNDATGARAIRNALGGTDEGVLAPYRAKIKELDAVIAARQRAGGVKIFDGSDYVRKTGATVDPTVDPTGNNPNPKGSAGKSEAQRDADQLTQSYERMVAKLTEQAAMVGVVSEVERLRYELNNGEMAKLSEGQKNELLNLAQIAEFRKEDYEALQESIKAEEEKTKLAAQAMADNEEVLAFMREDYELMGMSNKEREREYALRQLNKDATLEQIEAVKMQADANYELAESLALTDDLKAGLADMFVDFVSGAKSAKEAFGDFADSLFKRALQFVADKAINAMFDAFSGGGNQSASASGGAAGGWGGFFSSLLGAFGGGKASGGMARPNTLYEVNERGFEMATVGGRDYMMTGNSPVQITPNHALRGGGGTQNNNFQFAAPTSPKTQTQIAARVGYEMRRAQRFGA